MYRGLFLFSKYVTEMNKMSMKVGRKSNIVFVVKGFKGFNNIQVNIHINDYMTIAIPINNNINGHSGTSPY